MVANFVYFCTPKNKREDSVAQLVEQYTFNVWVLGSSPNGITNEMRSLQVVRFEGFLIFCTFF